MISEPTPIDSQERQANRLRTLAESSNAFAEATTDIERLLKMVAQRFADLIGDGCYIRLVGADGVSLEPVATYHPDPDTERFLRTMTDDVTLRVGEGISGKVVETGNAVLMPHVPFEHYAKLTKPEFAAVFETIGITSMVVVCLRARGVNHGFIALVRNGTGRPPYTDDDLHLVQDLADRAAMAIDSGRLVRDLERRVMERTRALESANRELEAFSYSISHDLRAPLRAIDGFSQILEEDHTGSLDEAGRNVVAVIRKNTQRMGHLIEDLLRFSQFGRQAMKLVQVQMRSVVDIVVDELRAAEPTRVLDFRIGELPSVVCDYGLIRQVWTNLLGNAVKYSRGRPVTIVEISSACAAGETSFVVKDNGSGFDSQYAHKLFQVFQRLHATSEFEGTGVGLALVHRIVSRHGGRVWAESQLTKGATFRFALPLQPPPADLAPPHPSH